MDAGERVNQDAGPTSLAHLGTRPLGGSLVRQQNGAHRAQLPAGTAPL
jgi:hypothetical protein|eukprot:COSAG06_NODE_1872_length_8166_cov_74.691211_2_plen_48_part_00